MKIIQMLWVCFVSSHPLYQCVSIARKEFPFFPLDDNNRKKKKISLEIMGKNMLFFSYLLFGWKRKRAENSISRHNYKNGTIVMGSYITIINSTSKKKQLGVSWGNAIVQTTSCHPLRKASPFSAGAASATKL